MTVKLPNRNIINSKHIGLLLYQALSYKAKIVHLFSKLDKVLILLGQLCNSRIEIILTKQTIRVLNEDIKEIVIEGKRSQVDSM